jgi:hypothetical protein
MVACGPTTTPLKNRHSPSRTVDWNILRSSSEKMQLAQVIRANRARCSGQFNTCSHKYE